MGKQSEIWFRLVRIGMKRVIAPILAVMILVTAPISPAHAASWRIYNNVRFGTIADIPAQGFTPQPPSANGDGQTWVPAVNKQTLAAVQKSEDPRVTFLESIAPDQDDVPITSENHHRYRLSVV
jgi:hypothetical protein